MPYSGLNEVLNETGGPSSKDSSGVSTAGKEKEVVKADNGNSYGTIDTSYGNGVDDSDLSSVQPIFTAYQLSFIRNRLSSNQTNLRAIIDIFRKFATNDVDSMIIEVYPNGL